VGAQCLGALLAAGALVGILGPVGGFGATVPAVSVARAFGLEWLLSSPPTAENFEELPIVIAAPYGYGKDEPLVSNPDALEVAHESH
jgi:cytochrome c oxidase subunit 1